MERDANLSHGSANMVRDRLFFNSDFYRIHVCEICGMIAESDVANNRFQCKCQKPYNRTKIAQVYLPYSMKLLIQELMSMCIASKLILE